MHWVTLTVPWLFANGAFASALPPQHHKRQSSTYLNPTTQPFAVDGSALPEVNFDVGESYAGTLSIDGNSSNPDRLWFWFFPSQNPSASDEITLWLNGGPGCSSLGGLFQENGPFLWQPGTSTPKPNPFSWTNLTNMIWVDQPIGVGFSPFAGNDTLKVTNEDIAAAQFAGFWKNFMTTFNLTGRQVYLTGESYAGKFIPYIADYMLSQNDTNYYNVKGISINDPVIGNDVVATQVPAVAHMNAYAKFFSLNDTFTSQINQRAETCGWNAYMKRALTFPPDGKFSIPIPTNECYLQDEVTIAASEVNPCFNIYHITDYCPSLSDELTSSNSYFNRSDVQKVIHAPPTDYRQCGTHSIGLNLHDPSPPSSVGPLPRVVERTNNVIVGSGLLDFLLPMNGTLMALNNMTWNGQQGFMADPLQGDKLFVPRYRGRLPGNALLGGWGTLGTTHTERGLTFTTVNLAGHELPQYAPTAAYRHLEFLLGRIANLTVQDDFSTEKGNSSGTASQLT